ncbi:L,D-transpeptidase family protein [Calderihabitans maritimus]|nr:peptidoglycan-binding protein [Calderihabitans maritimus]
MASSSYTFPLGAFGGCDDTNRKLYLTRPYLSGSDVEELQERLHQLNFDPGPIDGIYGPQTEAAVKKFQVTHGFAPDGIVDDTIWKLLGKGFERPTTTKQLNAPEGIIHLVIDTNNKTLTVYANNKPLKTYPVAVGRTETPTPVGEWKIISKSSDWGGGFGTRWMGLNVPWGIYGIHGTNKPWSIGQRASHGCIRMFNRDVEELFNWVSVGTPVKITGQPQLPAGIKRRVLQPKSVGPDVVQVQMKLKEHGFYLGMADGRFGRMTETAVRYFQIFNNLEPDGKINQDDYQQLGL